MAPRGNDSGRPGEPRSANGTGCSAWSGMSSGCTTSCSPNGPPAGWRRDALPRHGRGRYHRLASGGAPGDAGRERGARARQLRHRQARERRALARPHRAAGGQRRGSRRVPPGLRRGGLRAAPGRRPLGAAVRGRAHGDARGQRDRDADDAARGAGRRGTALRVRLVLIGVRRRRDGPQGGVGASQPAVAVRGGQAGGRAVLPGVHIGVRARHDLAALLQRVRAPPGPGVAVRRGGAEVHRGRARRRVARDLRRRLADARLHVRGGRGARQHAGVPGPRGGGRHRGERGGWRRHFCERCVGHHPHAAGRDGRRTPAASPRRGGAAFGRFAGAGTGGAGLLARGRVARGPAVDVRVAPGAPEAGGVTGEDARPDPWYGRLGRNLSFSTVSFGLRVGVHVLLLVLAARVLSTEAFGPYALAISLGSIFVVLCDYGFNFLVTREIAQRFAAAGEVLPSGALAKALLSLVALGLLGVTLAILRATPAVVAASVIITLSFAVNSYGTYLTAAFKGLQRFDAETLSYVALYGVLFVSQAIVLWLAPSPVNLALCFLPARVAYLVVCIVLYGRGGGVSWARPNPGEAWRMVVQSSPFAFYALSAALSLQLGTVMLSYFAGEAAVGEFQQALRFGMAATIPLAIADDVFYAFLADVRARAPDQFPRRLVLLNKAGATVIVALTVATLLYAPDLVRAAYGGRTAPLVAEALRIVMGAYCCLYLLFVSPPLMALRRDGANLGIWALGAAVNVAANFVLIPAWGVLGAAWSLFVTYAAIKLVFLGYMRRLRAPVADWDLVARSLLPLAAVGVIARALDVGAAAGLTLLGAVAGLVVWSLAPRERWAQVLRRAGP